MNDDPSLKHLNWRRVIQLGAIPSLILMALAIPFLRLGGTLDRFQLQQSTPKHHLRQMLAVQRTHIEYFWGSSGSNRRPTCNLKDVWH